MIKVLRLRCIGWIKNEWPEGLWNVNQRSKKQRMTKIKLDGWGE